METRFNQEAKNWDNDLSKIERAKIVATEIINFIEPNINWKAFEFGCGTGLLSFELKNYFKSITLSDTSEGMIEVLNEKIKKNHIKNFNPLLINLLKDDFTINNYDVIYTMMTLHHIKDINKLLKIFNTQLKTNGFLCIADLVAEDGSFHSNHPDFDGHKGFDKNELSQLLKAQSFQIKYYKIYFEIEKKVKNKIKKYPLFLMICKKDN